MYHFYCMSRYLQMTSRVNPWVSIVFSMFAGGHLSVRYAHRTAMVHLGPRADKRPKYLCAPDAKATRVWRSSRGAIHTGIPPDFCWSTMGNSPNILGL